MSEASARVVVTIATYRRAEMLRALLQSLADQGPELFQIIVTDNGADAATKSVVEASPVPARYLRPEKNLGCGGGLKLALEMAMQETDATHFWILDDDALATAGALTKLIAAIRTENADAAVPLITDGSGNIGWFPGLLEREKWKAIKRPGLTPEQYLSQCGPAPVAFSWSAWPSLIVSRHALETVGLPRPDYWYQGEDLEFVLRITYRLKGVLVPTALCKHLPPGQASADQNHEETYIKTCLSMQNSLYTFVRLPHGRRAAKHVPGHYRRFFKNFGFSLRSVRDVWRVTYLSIIAGRTADMPGGRYFKDRWLEWRQQK